MPPKKKGGAASGGKRKAAGSGASAKRSKKASTDDVGSSSSAAAASTDISQYDFSTNCADKAKPEVFLNEEEKSTKGGQVVFFGTTLWDLPSGKQKKDIPAVYNPSCFTMFDKIPVRTVAAGPTATHFVVVAVSGHVFTFGRNDAGQLGLGDTISRDEPCLVADLAGTPVVRAAVGRRHTLLLTADGEVFAAGCNTSGQLGQGNLTSKSTFTKVAIPCPDDTYVTRIACGAEFSAAVRSDGGLFMFGHPDYGQLGNGTDGKYFVTATKLSYRFEESPMFLSVFCEKDRQGHAAKIEDVKIKDISCGPNHSVALDEKGRVFTWGFGGYGRLGHEGSSDEKVPRSIALFARDDLKGTLIAAGGTCSLAVNLPGQLYFWGQTKMSGEATMYPKPEYELSGWNIQHIAAGKKHIVVYADKTIVVWGPSPCYGELGLGEKKKSSTKPSIVEALEGAKVVSLAAGFANTLAVVENKEVTDKLPKL